MVNRQKRILFISPAFFGYEISICDALKENGYLVDYYDERTSNNSLMKAVFRIKKSLLNNVVKKYYQSITDKVRDKKYDYFFLIKGEVVPESFIIDFKNNNPGARLIYYTYDSIKNNNKNSIYILKHFDDCYSFDFEDVKTNPLLKIKHLFYTKEYTAPHEAPEDRKYTIAFVGTLHSNRYQVVKVLFEKIKDTFVFFYSPARWFFILERIFKNHYKGIGWSDVSFNKLTKQGVADIFRLSKSVLDIQRFGQTGLTMRTFEVLASGAILVTTNTYIKEAKFYDPDYIIVIEDFNDLKKIEEIKTKTISLKEDMLTKNPGFEEYFVNNWVKEFFE
jgi:hypothetical protein